MSVSTRTLSGPSSVTVPNGTGYLKFPGGDGELRTGPADAHPRSEAAYPVVQSFVSVVKKPEGVGLRMTIGKGQPILFLPIGTKKEKDGTTVEETKVVLGTNKRTADRRFQGATKYLAIVGRNKYSGSDEYLLSAGYVAFAAEPTAIEFDKEGDLFSNITAISCAVEYESDILATSVPCNENADPRTATDHFPAGTAIMAGIFYDTLAAGGAKGWDPAEGSDYCIRACAGFPDALHNLCGSGKFVPRRCATAIVPFVALPMDKGEMTMLPPVRAAIIARPFPSTVM